MANIVSPGSLKAFKITAIDSTTFAKAIVETLNPVMYENDDTAMIVIVDGHAWDLASVTRVADILNGGDGENAALESGTGDTLAVAELTAFAAV